MAPRSHMGTVMTTSQSTALTCWLNCVKVVGRCSWPDWWRGMLLPNPPVPSCHHLVASMGVGRGTFERRNRVTSTSLVQNGLASHCTILSWMSPWTTIVRWWEVIPAAQNVLIEYNDDDDDDSKRKHKNKLYLTEFHNPKVFLNFVW